LAVKGRDRIRIRPKLWQIGVIPYRLQWQSDCGFEDRKEQDEHRFKGFPGAVREKGQSLGVANDSEGYPQVKGGVSLPLAHIDEPDENWKFSLADIHESKHWKHYMKAYGACLPAISTRYAPWYVVRADDRKNARLIVSRVVLDALEDLKMAYPKTSPKRLTELHSIRKLLTK
jgi:polyphosphate kinase 2 PPK2